MSDESLTFLILGITVLVFIWDRLPVAIGVAVSPRFATPANLMVIEPAGYRFGDYWKLGLPLLVLYGAVAVRLVPVFWSF